MHTLTRAQPAGWTGYARRVDAALLRRGGLGGRADGPLAFVCGPTSFVETVADGLVALGYRAGACQDRAVRLDGRTLMNELDGNAIAGTLHEVFGDEMTTATTVCAHCGDERVVGELVVYVRAPGDRRALPDLRGPADGAGRGAWGHLRRPERSRPVRP